MDQRVTRVMLISCADCCSLVKLLKVSTLLESTNGSDCCGYRLVGQSLSKGVKLILGFERITSSISPFE